MDVIFNVFKWFVQAVGDVVNLITSIPNYVGKFISLINSFMPYDIGLVILLCISAYVIIHIKRLVF